MISNFGSLITVFDDKVNLLKKGTGALIRVMVGLTTALSKEKVQKSFAITASKRVSLKLTRNSRFTLRKTDRDIRRSRYFNL